MLPLLQTILSKKELFHKKSCSDLKMIIIFFISQHPMKFEICDLMVSINTERGFFGVQNHFWVIFLHHKSLAQKTWSTDRHKKLLENTLNQAFFNLTTCFIYTL